MKFTLIINDDYDGTPTGSLSLSGDDRSFTEEDVRAAAEILGVEVEISPRRCDDCGVYTFNANHVCVKYDASHPCPECGAPSVFVTISAPGTGSGWQCENGHYDGTCRLQKIGEVI